MDDMPIQERGCLYNSAVLQYAALIHRTESHAARFDLIINSSRELERDFSRGGTTKFSALLDLTCALDELDAAQVESL